MNVASASMTEPPPVDGELAGTLISMIGQRVPLLLADTAAPGQPIVYASPAFLDLTGYGLSEVLGRDCHFMHGPDTEDAAAQSLRQALALGHSTSVELVNYRKDGSRFQTLVHLDPVPVDGQPRYFLGVHQDLTRRVAADAAALATGAAAEDAPGDGDKDLLLRDLRHRTDNALQLVLSLLRLRAAHAKEPLASAALDNAVERIEGLVRVQRYLNRLGHGNAVQVKRPLEQLCEGLLGATGDGVTLAIECDEVELPAARITPLLLFVNEALTNALRHGFKGGRQGEVTVRLERQAGSGFVLTIEDNGVGLLEGMDLLQHGGLGGLLLKAFAGQLRGRLEVESAQGLRLTLRVP